MIITKIEDIRRLRGQMAQICRELSELSRPMETDVSKIPAFYEKFLALADAKNRDNVKIFIFLMFFAYSPSACVGRGVRGEVRRCVAKLLRVSCTVVSQKFGDAKVLFMRHRRFREETERIFQRIFEDANP